jgi:hypothetical protein
LEVSLVTQMVVNVAEWRALQSAVQMARTSGYMWVEQRNPWSAAAWDSPMVDRWAGQSAPQWAAAKVVMWGPQTVAELGLKTAVKMVAERAPWTAAKWARPRARCWVVMTVNQTAVLWADCWALQTVVH